MAYLTTTQVKERIGSKATGWADTRLESLIERFENLAEEYLGCAYEPRERTVTVRPGYSSTVVLPDPYVTEITAVTVDDTVWTEDQLTDLELDSDAGIIHCAYLGRVVVITYTHGQAAPPEALLDACVEFVKVKYLKQSTNRSKQIESQTDDSGNTYTLGRADASAGRPTGIPEVDDALNELPMHRLPGVA